MTLAGVAPPTSKPVKVPLVISVVGAVVTKSSAVSVSNLPTLAVRDSVAIKPSGLPVLKTNGAAVAGAAKSAVVARRLAQQMDFFISSSCRLLTLSGGLLTLIQAPNLQPAKAKLFS